MLDDAGRVHIAIGPAGTIYLPLRWVDLQAWRDCTGTAADGAQMRTLVMLSAVLAGEMNAAAQMETEAPFVPD